jgi:predicted enzyme related to lactoylglutathione lyase
MAHGQITHIEFPADDTDRARRFYSELFGWSFREAEGFGGYFLFNVGTAEIGGAVGVRGTATGERLRVYAEVDSIDEILRRTPELGGAIVDPKQEVSGQGWFAVISDSEGNEVGLYEASPI